LSRYLSQALGQDEAKFRHALMALERRSGHLSHDLRLSSKVLQATRIKLEELGLDPKDTTAEELYFTLNHKLAEQDSLLTKRLRTLAAKRVNAEANVSDGLLEVAKMLSKKDCFVLKASVLKSQLKDQPPKKVMKALGYRSLDSMLKLEPACLILLAINFLESEAYLHNFYAKYKKYNASNFESKKLSVLSPQDKRWLPMLGGIQKQTGLTLISNYETASLILMPISNELKPGYLTMATANLLSELTTIYSVSSFLKLHQVRSDFGLKLTQIAENQPYLDKKLLGSKISWPTALDILKDTDSSTFAPHMTSSELANTSLLGKLSDILSDFKFWQDSEFLALIKSSEVTSFNILDVASNLVNQLPFSRRRLDHFRQALTAELMKLYISPEQLIASLSNEQNTEDNILADNKAQAVY
jgi:hypothetical protein